MSQHQYFHFSLGPVQSFVASARRSRDFWAGSFLLSWLSGVAIEAVKHQGGSIVFPHPPQAYLDAVLGKTNGKGPQQGVIPNRFQAVTAIVDEGFDPAQVVFDIKSAWLSLAEILWQNDIAGAAEKLRQSDFNIDDVRAIWQRQIADFWQLSWVMTDSPDTSDLMDRRKNWRSHQWSDEPGNKCTVMPDWQELCPELKPHRNVELRPSFAR